MLQNSRKYLFSNKWLNFDEKNTFLPKKKSFFVNFNKIVSKQQKSLVELYVAHFDDKNTYLT